MLLTISLSDETFATDFASFADWLQTYEFSRLVMGTEAGLFHGTSPAVRRVFLIG